MKYIFKKGCLSLFLLVSIISYAQQKALRIAEQLFELRASGFPSLDMHSRKRIEAYICLLIDFFPLEKEFFDQYNLELKEKILELLRQRINQPIFSKDKECLLRVLSRAFENNWIDEISYLKLKTITPRDIDSFISSFRRDVSSHSQSLILIRLAACEISSFSPQLDMRLRLLIHNLIQKIGDSIQREINLQKISNLLEIHLEQLPPPELREEIVEMLMQRIENFSPEVDLRHINKMIKNASAHNWIDENTCFSLSRLLEGSNVSVGYLTEMSSLTTYQERKKIPQVANTISLCVRLRSFSN
jgi:hypothetical protein